MVNKLLRKCLVLGIITLFFGLSVIPSISGNFDKLNSVKYLEVDSKAISKRNVIYVDDDNTNGPWDGSIEHPYQFIQDGINAAQDGDKVIVADGIYTGENNKDLNFNGKNIILQSINGPNNCVIDCENDGRGFMFYSGENSSAQVDGITITNGNVIVNGGGGAIYISVESSPTIANCVIKNNQANIAGGGILIRRCSSPKIINCTIINNTALQGGGIRCFTNGDPGFPTIVNCKILDNVAYMNAGGGICSSGYDIDIINCLIAGNKADNYYYGAFGGGISFEFGDCKILDCTITDNYATSFSGGIYCYQADMMIENCIIWNNLAPLGSEISLEQSMIWISYSDVESGEGAIYYLNNSEIVWGEGNIDSDPLFMDPNDGNYQLNNFSFCIDAGDNYAVPSGVILDLEGNPRFVDIPNINDTGNGTPPIVDIGAYELQVTLSNNTPPNVPDISGPSSGTIGISYQYNFVTTDPEGDDVYYWIEWFEDDPSAKWEGPYSSSETITLNHTWSEQGTYIITAKAKDIYGAESEWGYLEVTMPRNKIYVNQQLNEQLNQQLILKILEQFTILKNLPLRL